VSSNNSPSAEGSRESDQQVGKKNDHYVQMLLLSLVIGIIAFVVGIVVSAVMIQSVTSTTTSTSTATVTVQANYPYFCSIHATNNGVWEYVGSFYSNSDVSDTESLNGQVVFQIQCTPS
jgi:ABC-type antimicrobial peptide transport system permease subunit